VVLAILQTVDRNQGPVPFRAIAEAAQRRGRVAGDLNTATSAIAAATRGDNLRRLAAGQRPRFRFGQGGRVAPTDWVLGSELLRFEQDALLAIERYRDASRRVLSSKLQKDMSGPALVELLLLVLDRIGFKDVRPVRRAGLPGGESHFSAIHVTAGGEEIRTAIVLRRDGREIGRERVIDLRGSLHHYGPASAGWLLTTGQVLSGAREEASAPGTTPITLFDSVGFARLLEENDIAVVKTKIALAIPDVELLETLRGL
ncbi:MAG: restriction endonuclease, partial [Polyangiales bacterium]